LIVQDERREFPRAVALPSQHLESLEAQTARRSLWRQSVLGFMFAPLACPAVLDLSVSVFRRVAQHLETWVLCAAFLILSFDGLLADRRRASRYDAHRILRKDV